MKFVLAQCRNAKANSELSINSPNTIGTESTGLWAQEVLTAFQAHPAADPCTLSSPFYIRSFGLPCEPVRVLTKL